MFRFGIYYIDDLSSRNCVKPMIIFFIYLAVYPRKKTCKYRGSMMKAFAKIVYDKKLLTNFANSSMIDVGQGFKFAFKVIT